MVLLTYAAARGWLRRAARATDPAPTAMAPLHSALALWVGALWTLHGLLQARQLMATRFVGGFLAPPTAGQPAPVAAVAAIIRLGTQVWGVSPIWFNVLATFLQILIGLSILLTEDGSQLRRIALSVSITCGLGVWSVGEAFGSLFSAGGPLVGSPGAVLLYMVAGVLLLMPPRHWESEGRLWRWMPVGFVGLFALQGLLSILPADGWWAAAGLGGYVAGVAQMPQPHLFAAPLTAWAASLTRHPMAWNAVIAASCLTLGLA